MLDANFVTVLRDSNGTADGRCVQCQTYISVSVPLNESAIEELSRLFDQHFAEVHYVSRTRRLIGSRGLSPTK
jgi:hypothetical protein